MFIPSFKRSLALVGSLILAVRPAAAAPPGPGWELAWSEEFGGSSIDSANWNVSTGNRRDAVNTPNALSVQDGYLRIKTYTENGTHYTGWIGSNGKFENCFGYWEARIRYNSSQGMWSAFWLQPYGINNVGDPAGNGTEIDIAEHRSRDAGGANLTNHITMNIHWDGYGASHKSTGSTAANPGVNPASLQGNFHTYGLLWEPGRYRFYVDGVEVWTTTAAISQVRQWIYLTSEVDNGAWAGPTPSSYGSRTTSNTYQDIDYVRFYQRKEQTINSHFGNRFGPWRTIGAASWASNGGRGGSAGARMNPSNTSGGRVAQRVVGLLPNTPYVVRGWGNVGSRTWPDVRIGARDYGGPEVWASIWSNGFTEGLASFTTGASNSSADVFAWVPTQYGDGYADEIEIRRAGRFTNGGFEIGDGSHWTIFGDALVQGWGGQFRRAGSHALRLNQSTASRGCEQRIHGLKPNTNYTLSAWIRGSGQSIRLGVKNHGAAEAFSPATGTGSWTRISHAFTTGASATEATLYAFIPAGSNTTALDIDEFLLTEALPGEWTTATIGAVAAGEAGTSDGRLVLRGTGNNLGGTSDACHFAHQPMVGDGKITVKLNSFESAHERAKAGLMLRADTSTGAPFAMVHWLPEGQCEFIWRNTAGSAASYVWASGGTAWPPRLRLTRTGSLVGASFSTDGTNWTNIGSPQVIDLPPTCLAGLAVTSHETDDAGEAVFANFSFTADRDGDGLTDDYETNTGTYISATNTGTDPDNPDTDEDGIPDGLEVANGTNPLVPNNELIWQPGVAPGGAGTWNTTSPSWRLGESPTPWLPGKIALFGGTGGTVSVPSSIAGIEGMIFNGTGYLLDGAGNLNLGENPFLQLNAASATIAAPLAGTAELAITGGVPNAQLQLRGNHSGFAGAMVLDGNVQLRPYNTSNGNVTGNELGGPAATIEVRAGSQIRWFGLASSVAFPVSFHLSGNGITGGNPGALNHDGASGGASRTITLNGPVFLDANARIGTQNNGAFSIQGDLAGDATLTFEQNASSSTIAGPTDLDGLVKTGAGTLVIAGSNTTIGQTTVSAGTLQVGNGATNGALQGNVAISSGATLAFSRSDTHGFAGSISGAGTLSKQNTGTLVLSGGNAIGTAGSTYTFGNLGTSNLGAIRLAHPLALGNYTRIRLNQWQAGVSTLELSGGHVFPIAVESAGRNTSQGHVLLRNVEGANTLTGDISLVEAGGAYHIETLAGSSLFVQGRLQTTLNNLAPRDVRFRGDGDITIAGGFSDSTTTTPVRLAVVKEGAGTLRLLGTSGHLLSTEVAAGTIDIDGVITASTVNVAAAAAIEGSGTAPALTLAGTLRRTIGESPLQITGPVNLTGASLRIIGIPSAPEVTLLSYGSLTGTFASVVGLPPGYRLETAAVGNRVALVRLHPTYGTWISAQPGTNGQTQPTQDPDGDGVVNLLEFSFRRQAGQPDGASGLPEFATTTIAGKNHLVLRYTRPKGVAELAFTAQFTGHPSTTWDEAGPGTVVAENTETETLEVIDPVPLGEPGSPRRFGRVKVTATGL